MSSSTALLRWEMTEEWVTLFIQMEKRMKINRLFWLFQHDFGQVAQIKLNIIPVIPSLIENPLFGK